MQLAETEFRMGDGNRARDLQAQALALRRKRVEVLKKKGTADDPEIANAESDVADSLGLLAYVDLRVGDPASAVEHYSASDRMFWQLPPPTNMYLKTRRIRAEIKVRLADSFARLGKLDDAEKLYREALADRESLLNQSPRPSQAVPLLKEDVGQSRMYIGDFLLMFRKNRAAAAAEYTACLEIFAPLHKADPDNLNFRQRLAATHYRIGFSAADPMKARQAFAECLKIRQELAAVDPRDTQSGVEVALALARVGNDAEAERAVASLLKQAATDRQVLFQVACTLSVVSGVTTNPDTARRCREQAFQVLRELIKAGWKDRGGLETDPDFDFIRDDPRFKELLKGLAAR